MNAGNELERLQRWLVGADSADERAIRDGLHDIHPEIWPAFSGQAAADLDLAQETGQMPAPEAMLKRRLLGEERQRREYPVYGRSEHAG